MPRLAGFYVTVNLCLIPFVGLTTFAVNPSAQNSTRLEEADALQKQSEAFFKLGDIRQALSLAEQAFLIKEQELGAKNPLLASAVNVYANLLFWSGNLPKAKLYAERALKLREERFGPAHLEVAESLNNVAAMSEQLGELSQARALAERALGIRQVILGPEHPAVGHTLNTLARILFKTGELSEARRYVQQALEIREATLGPNHIDVAATLDTYVLLLQQMQDIRAAQVVAERALEIREKSLDPLHPDVAYSLNRLAVLSLRLNETAKARLMAQRALKIYEQKLGAGHHMVASVLNTLGDIYFRRGDLPAALAAYNRSAETFKNSLGHNHPDVAISLNNVAIVLRHSNEIDKALAILETALRLQEEGLGENHPFLCPTLNNLAGGLVQKGALLRAWSSFERCRRIQMEWRRINGDFDVDESRDSMARTPNAWKEYLALLAQISVGPYAQTIKDRAAENAFPVAEEVRDGQVQRALSKAAARFSASNNETAELIWQLQNLRHRRATVQKQWRDEYGKNLAARDTQQLTSLQQSLKAIDTEIERSLKKIRESAPEYSELSFPDQVDTQTVKGLLHADEALVSLVTLNDRLLIWFLRPGQSTLFRAIPVNKKDLVVAVTSLRRSLDQSENNALNRGLLLPFDVDHAYHIFQLIFSSFKSDLVGVKNLLIVPDEVFLRVSFGALVTSAEGNEFTKLSNVFARNAYISNNELSMYSNLSWLAKDYTLTVLPSATSLRAVRQTRRDFSSSPLLLIGFGDPVLQGTGRERGGKMVAVRGIDVNVRDLVQLGRLPGTRDELLAIAEALNVPVKTSLYLGPDATETELVKLNKSGRLGKARLLFFATHGLLGGELKGLSQPALVLTPPDTPSQDDDGLLSMEDVLNLKLLQNQWVVLSACNTGIANGSLEGFSGLVRSFFFAGTRALLVSHWSVDDEATRHLMVKVFQRYTKDSTMSRSEALRQGMLSLARGQEEPYFAHPFAWAAFFLVGEGSGTFK